MNSLPRTSGTYILWLKLLRERRLEVGRLGEILFRPGYYAYTGSAFGPGGLKARLGHHLAPTLRPRWHIDYLKRIAGCVEIWISTSPQKLEHRFAAHMAALPGAEIPAGKFGSTDCDCPAHLVFFSQQPDVAIFEQACPEKLETYRFHINV